MGSVTIEDKNRIPELIEQLRYLSTHKLEIGVFGEEGSTVLMVARVHEFGCKIKITKKMRGYLWHEGMNLSPKTEYINIPERSYIRSGFDDNADKIQVKAN